MFKNCTIFSIGDRATFDLFSHGNLHETLALRESGEPGKTDWYRLGFGKPAHFGTDDGQFVFSGLRSSVMYVEKQERVLPGKVIQRAVNQRAAEIEERQGYKPNKKQFAEIREAITSEMLPNAFVKASGTHVMMTWSGSQAYLMIDSGSTKLVDDIIELLRRTFEIELQDHEDEDDRPHGDMNLKLFRSGKTAAWLKEIALADEPAGHFERLDGIVVEGKDKDVSRFKDTDLEKGAVQKIVLDGRVKELAVAYYKDVILNDGEQLCDLHLAVTESLVVKRIKFSDVILKQAEQDAEGEDAVTHFDATIAIVSSLLHGLARRLEAATAEDDEL